ncbi:WD repeat-containing protein 78, partial [Asbolus verrucosus]
ITLILNETETIFLLELASSIAPKGTEEGEAAEIDNQRYEYITKGKGRNRKVASIGVQTLPLLMKTRSTEPVKYEFRDNSTFASNWEMYDTYNAGLFKDVADKEIEEKEEVTVEKEEVVKLDDHKLNDEIDPEDFRKTKYEKEIGKLRNNQRFFDAALIIERLLANNYYNEQQKQFKGLVDQSDLEDRIKYNYKLGLLWTFANEDTKSRCVTEICFNDFTEDILAVGYGVVMIWNIKNPKQPERQYFFQHSVTSLVFSKINPNFLAVGFYNGHVKILDVSKRELKVLREDRTTSFEPVWSILCLQHDDMEYFLACFGDGQICKYEITAVHLECVQVMRTVKIEGKMKGAKAMRMFEGNEVSSARYAQAICLTLHSSDPSIYFVGTNEGAVHRCTAHYCNQHLDMFKAHEGSIHGIKFSPFVNKVYATCGDDFQMCLWVEGIDEPLILSRYCMEPVLDLAWSPSHSTILVSLQGMDILLWDFQRKIYSPQSQTKSPTNSRNIICRFTASGRCLIVGVEVTPVSLNPYVYEGSKERQISILDNLTKDTSFFLHASLSRVESQKFHANLLQQKQELETATFNRRSYLTSTYGDEMLITEITGASSRSDFSREITDEEELSTHETNMQKIPEHISLILTETETIFLLDIASCTVPKGTEEGDLVEEDNKLYDYLTKGKGRNRKVLSVGVQTLPILMKGRDTETEKIRYKNTSTFVSTWEMYDTFYKKEQESEEESDDEENLSNDENELITIDNHRLNDEASLESYRVTLEEKQISKLVKSKTFFDALIVIERILGSNCYNEQQKRFKGLSDPDIFREDMVYKYRLQLLWTYANDATESKCVSAIAFNSFTEDIVAVAYGKYFYNDRNCVGMVMIWNFKNPQQPERNYDFKYPVTSIAFSKVNPNLLAVGMYNGDVKVLDVSKREEVVIRENKTTSFEPVWSIVWFQQGDDEDIMASFGDGRVCRFQITGAQELKLTQIMITAAAEGKLKGIKYLKKCEDKDISINRYEEARCLALHPSDPYTYFVGTNEGVVHRCSTNYYNEHMDLFKAHDGAIHTVKFSPFANKLYYTCGDDFRARLWVDGIHEPLVTSEPSTLPVLDVDWSPTNSTVVATIRGPDILVWDLQRKMYESQSVTKSPRGVFNTICRFTPNGRCLMVGDMAGDVHVYSLEDMPIPPFFPENLITLSLKKLLVTKPELVKKIRKLGSLNFDKRHFSKYFN